MFFCFISDCIKISWKINVFQSELCKNWLKCIAYNFLGLCVLNSSKIYNKEPKGKRVKTLLICQICYTVSARDYYHFSFPYLSFLPVLLQYYGLFIPVVHSGLTFWRTAVLKFSVSQLMKYEKIILKKTSCGNRIAHSIPVSLSNGEVKKTIPYWILQTLIFTLFLNDRVCEIS